MINTKIVCPKGYKNILVPKRDQSTIRLYANANGTHRIQILDHRSFYPNYRFEIRNIKGLDISETKYCASFEELNRIVSNMTTIKKENTMKKEISKNAKSAKATETTTKTNNTKKESKTMKNAKSEVKAVKAVKAPKTNKVAKADAKPAKAVKAAKVAKTEAVKPTKKVVEAPKVEKKVRANKKSAAVVEPKVRAKRGSKDISVELKADGIIFTPARALVKAVNSEEPKAKKARGTKTEKVAKAVKAAKVAKADAKPAKKESKKAKVINLKDHERRSMKTLAPIAAKIAAVRNEKAAKRVFKAYSEEVGAETAARNLRFILRHLNDETVSELFAPYRKADTMKKAA